MLKFSRLARRHWLLLMCTALAIGLTGCGGGGGGNGDGSGPGDGSGGGNGKGNGQGKNANSGSTKRIVILTNGPDPFWDTCEIGARDAEEELGLADSGFKVDFHRGDFTDKKQIDMLKQYGLDPDIVAVGISVFNPDNLPLIEEMRALQEKGVKVVTIDSDVNRDEFRDARFAYLGTDNIIGGRELGRAAKAVAPEGANFAFFVGSLGVANAVDRMQGFVEGAGDDFQELARRSDDGKPAEARRNVENALNQFSELNMLVGIWAYDTPQIINVVRDRNIRDKTKVICFDAAEASIDGMMNGQVDVMVVQNPYQMGHHGVKLMHALVSEDQAVVDEMYPEYAKEGEKDVFRTELRVVIPDSGSSISGDLFEESTILFKASEFKEWLEERSLISS
ncbi:MAG: substrate-binding domain-containing protein [Planctomycetaceae bacterium]|nr:substrate-binding domain-containing protein [Planctomycetaceae bacterium]MCB9950162.1 substrate-binding domain-containing protein [Planctomycetaceae bacterium]